MKESRWQEELKDDLEFFFILFISGLIDTAFLILWALVQYGAGWLLNYFELSGIDQWVLSTLQVLFAITTVIPVLLYVIQDVWIMALKVQTRVRQARKSYARDYEDIK